MVQQTVTAGFHPDRKEVALDVLIHFEQTIDKTFFIDVFNAIFGDLEPAQAMFGAASEMPAISALMDAASLFVAFDLSFSAGIKVENALSVFSKTPDSSVDLFFRLGDVGIFAEAKVAPIDLDLFSTVTIEGGNFLLSAGVRIATPFEGEVTMDGNMATGISFSHSLGTLKFIPYGQLTASLPFKATINGSAMSLTIKFEDDNLFDAVKPLIKVDFPVCPVVSIVEGLLGKLGSLEMSPRSILGSIETAGLDLAGSLDEYFPGVAQYTEGILEGTYQSFSESLR